MLKHAHQYSRLYRMPEEPSIYCADEIYESIIANASPDQIEGLCGSIIMSRGTADHALDASFPELKTITPLLSGHKSSPTRYQIVFLENKYNESYLLDALDLRKSDLITRLSDLHPATLRECYLIAGYQPA